MSIGGAGRVVTAGSMGAWGQARHTRGNHRRQCASRLVEDLLEAMCLVDIASLWWKLKYDEKLGRSSRWSFESTWVEFHKEFQREDEQDIEATKLGSMHAIEINALLVPFANCICLLDTKGQCVILVIRRHNPDAKLLSAMQLANGAQQNEETFAVVLKLEDTLKALVKAPIEGKIELSDQVGEQEDDWRLKLSLAVGSTRICHCEWF
ncbi:Uncharacterized protein TCM_043877 [Theobroma cacao]|uniref:Uncharacterized protein n=1 Tax=Theobroma cacao TaxID=3641 RepID=A0A061FQE6_THECC|nr:Uncharacterized protein TCM_043877 [Theobroma cacao]